MKNFMAKNWWWYSFRAKKKNQLFRLFTTEEEDVDHLNFPVKFKEVTKLLLVCTGIVFDTRKILEAWKDVTNGVLYKSTLVQEWFLSWLQEKNDWC